MTLLFRRERGRLPAGTAYIAGRTIREGGVVVFPTETVYGMGADALNSAAVKRIFEIKGRPLDNPVIVHVCSRGQVEQLARDVPAMGRILMERFWPGPLTLVLRKGPAVPAPVTAGLDTVSVRMPDNRTALSLIRQARTPIAAPSANISGRPSITSFEEAVGELDGLVDVIIDGGSSRIGVESTVLDLTSGVPSILRPGGVTAEQLREIMPGLTIHPAAEGFTVYRGKAPSPGMKYRHYAPVHSRVLLFEPQPGLEEAMIAKWRQISRSGRTAAFLVTDETEIHTGTVVRLGSRERPEEIARRLFSSLRQLDRSGVDYILAEGIGEEGIGLAVMNRLRRSAGKARGRSPAHRKESGSSP